jgi:hypothetical protein
MAFGKLHLSFRFGFRDSYQALEAISRVSDA